MLAKQGRKGASWKGAGGAAEPAEVAAQVVSRQKTRSLPGLAYFPPPTPQLGVSCLRLLDNASGRLC